MSTPVVLITGALERNRPAGPRRPGRRLAVHDSSAGSKVLVEGSILQHMIGSRQDRSGDSTNRLLVAATRAQAMILRLEIAGLLAGGGPGTLNEGGLEPRRSFAHSGGAALAGTLIVLRTEA